MANLYVGNLSWDATEEDVTDYFGQEVKVNKVNIIKDRDTGRSKGFCFIDVDNNDKAIQKFDGTEFMGRRIVVNEARPPEKREYRDSRDRGRDDRHYDDRRR